MSQIEADKVVLQCTCGKKLKAPASAAGRKAKCPGCGNVLTIAAPPPLKPAVVNSVAAKPAPKKSEPAEDDLDGLYALADDEKHAAARGATIAAPPVSMTAAPAPSAPPMPLGYMPKGPITFPGAKTKAKVEDAMAPQSSFLKGLGMCASFALGGGIIWFLIAYFTGYELYFIALLVGGLAGVGMQYGQKGYSSLGGWASAGVTFFMILLAKIAVVAAVIYPLMANDGEDFAVIEYLHEKELQAKGINPDLATEKQDEDAYDAAERKYRKMDDAELQKIRDELKAAADDQELRMYILSDLLDKNPRAYQNEGVYEQLHKQADQEFEKLTPQQRKDQLAQRRAEAEEERNKLMAEWEAEEAAEAASGNAADDDGASAGEVAFFAVLFMLIIGWKSILFIIMAMFLAYRTAAGSVHG